MRESKSTIENKLNQQLETSIKLHEYLKTQIGNIIKISRIIEEALNTGKKVIVFGNGGSAADSQHMVGELIGRFYQERKPLRAIALTTNTTILTAIANDYGFKKVFSRQIEALAEKGDVVIGISTSGKSKNVLLGIEEAKKRGAITVALTGNKGILKTMADYSISIPSNDTPRIQEAHIATEHIICYLVENSFLSVKSV